MQSRMKNPAIVIPEAMQNLQALAKSAERGGVPLRTLGLVHLRASQINGCSVCVDLAFRFKKAEDTSERLFAVAAWRDAPWFSDAERAALALSEAVTRLSDRADPVPDEIWDAGRASLQPASACRPDPLDRHDQDLIDQRRRLLGNSGSERQKSARRAEIGYEWPPVERYRRSAVILLTLECRQSASNLLERTVATVTYSAGCRETSFEQNEPRAGSIRLKGLQRDFQPSEV